MKFKKCLLILCGALGLISSTVHAMGLGNTGRFLWRHKGVGAGLLVLWHGSVNQYREKIKEQRNLAASTESEETGISEEWKEKFSTHFAQHGMTVVFRNYTGDFPDVLNMGVARYGDHAILYLNPIAKNVFSEGRSGYQTILKVTEPHLSTPVPAGMKLIRSGKEGYLILEAPYTEKEGEAAFFHELGHALNRDHEKQIALEHLTLPIHAMIGVAGYKAAKHLTRSTTGLRQLGTLAMATGVGVAGFVASVMAREFLATTHRELRADQAVVDTQDEELLQAHINGLKKDEAVLQALRTYGLAKTPSLTRIPPLSLRIALAEKALERLKAANSHTKE